MLEVLYNEEEIRVLYDSDSKIADNAVFLEFLNSNSHKITQVKIQVESESLGIFETLKEGANIILGSPTEFNKVGDRVKEYLKTTQKNKKTPPAIYVSEKPSNVIEVAEQNPKVIAFLFSKEMDDEYNIQTLDLAISALNNLNDGDLERNRKLLIDAAQEYQELSKAIEDINKRRKVNNKISIGDYVEQKLGKDRDWLKAVREQLWLSSPLPIKSAELEFTDLPVEERINVIENRVGEESKALNSKKNDSPTSKVDVLNMVENYERTILVDKEDSFLGGPESSKGGSPIKLVPMRLWSDSPVIERSVTPLPNSSENFVSYDATKKIINFKVKSDNESIEDKFNYNKEPSEEEKSLLANTAESNKYLSDNYTKEKEQEKILKLLKEASTDTIEAFKSAKLESAKLDKDFFIDVMKVASKNCGITSIESEGDFKEALKEVNPALETKYDSQEAKELHKIAKYFSAKFQSLSEKDGYLTAREGRGNEVNKTPRRLFRVCTEENIQAFQAMQEQEAEKKLVVQHSIGKVEHSPRSSPSLPESHQAGKEASSGSPTMAPI
jgi:hypothetical protein